MSKRVSILTAALALGLAGTPALATGVTKTWVSSTTGNDTGTCQFVSPCKTFAYAITQTAAGGEIDVKDGGSYGPVTISQAVSIVAEGVLAAISVPPQSIGVQVAAGSNDHVTLHGIVIDGHGGNGTEGIKYTSGASLIVEQCQIRNTDIDGLYITGAAAHVSDTTVSHVSGTAIFIDSVSHNVSLSDVGVYDSVNGLQIMGATAAVVDSVLSGNQYGLIANVSSTVLLGQSTVSQNSTYGIWASKGIVNSYGNNDINANGADIKIDSGSFNTIQQR